MISPFVFPSSTSKSGHRMDIKLPWNRIRAKAKVEDVHFHDLRRTNASYQVALGASLSIIGSTLGHKSTSQTKKYAVLNIDPARASLEKAGQEMMEHWMAGVAKMTGKKSR